MANQQWSVDVVVMPKEGVNDPEGEAIRSGLHALGHEQVGRVRAGRLFALAIEAGSAAEARRMATEMADQLLANPVIERFEIHVHEGRA